VNAIQQDVVVVGAGPTGLALGAELHRQGVSAMVLDKLAAGDNTSRASVVHARTLEVLEPLGATAGLLQRGLIVPIFRIRDNSRILATVSFRELKTAYPFTLMCPQDRVEAILLGRLQSFGGDVKRPCEVIDIRQEQNDVQLQVKSGQEAGSIHARWLVGCDGAHSLVRERSGIPFEGDAYEESFILADVEMDWPLDREEVSLFYCEKGLVVVAPLPDDRFRIVASVRRAPDEPTITDFESILAECAPRNSRWAIRRMDWSSLFHIQHRIAKVLRQGQILLAGDAAHVHSPAGGQGMNTGIQDAVSLANALTQALRDGDYAILNKWETERLKIAHSVVNFTDRMTKLATLSSPILKLLRNTAVELMGNIPFAQHVLAEELSELTHQ
jgi:2-polyprenyl-6-methoxyphenol hydroxylase-like FAD-dependent oxidoreductase